MCISSMWVFWGLHLYSCMFTCPAPSTGKSPTSLSAWTRCISVFGLLLPERLSALMHSLCSFSLPLFLFSTAFFLSFHPSSSFSHSFALCPTAVRNTNSHNTQRHASTRASVHIFTFKHTYMHSSYPLTLKSFKWQQKWGKVISESKDTWQERLIRAEEKKSRAGLHSSPSLWRMGCTGCTPYRVGVHPV